MLTSLREPSSLFASLYNALNTKQEDGMLAQALHGSAINKIPNIPQCTLPPCPVYQTLLSDFSRVWLRDYSSIRMVTYCH